MDTVTKKQYLENPCRASSIPYWKAVCISIPDNMKILHDSEFNTELLKRYIDEPYFRLQHHMLEVKPVSLPEGYSLYKSSLPEFVEHINSCYENIGIAMSEMQDYLTRRQYSSELWLAVRDDCKRKVQLMPIRKIVPFGTPRCLRSFFLLIGGHSLSGKQWMKICASTIFNHMLPTG